MINNNNNLIYENYENVYIIKNNDSYDYIEKSIIQSKHLINKLENNNIKIYESDNLVDIIKFVLMMNVMLFIFTFTDL